MSDEIDAPREKAMRNARGAILLALMSGDRTHVGQVRGLVMPAVEAAYDQGRADVVRGLAEALTAVFVRYDQSFAIQNKTTQERPTNMTSTNTSHIAERGLEHRFDVQRVNDPTGKHEDCRYFVLDPQHDPCARYALRAYAAAAEEAGHLALTSDLRMWVERAYDQARSDGEAAVPDA